MDTAQITARNTKIVYAAMGLSVVAVIALIIFALNFNNIGKRQVDVTPTPEVSPTEEVPSGTPTPTTAPVNNTAKLYMIISNSKNKPGSVWMINPKDGLREALIPTDSVKQLVGFSPDNSFLAYIDNNSDLLVTKLQDKAVIRTGYKATPKQQVYWNSNSELAVVDYEASDKMKIIKIEIPAVKIAETSFLGKFNTGKIIANANQKVLIYKNSMNESNYRYLTESKTLTEIVDSLWMPQLWINDSEFLFSGDEGLYIYNTDLNNYKQIMSIRSVDNEPFSSTNFVKQGSSIYFVFEKQLYRYDLNTKVTRSISDLENYLGSGDLATLSVTPNEAFLTITINDKSYLFTMKDLTVKALCENYCGEIVVEN